MIPLPTELGGQISSKVISVFIPINHDLTFSHPPSLPLEIFLPPHPVFYPLRPWQTFLATENMLKGQELKESE